MPGQRISSLPVDISVLADRRGQNIAQCIWLSPNVFKEMGHSHISGRTSPVRIGSTHTSVSVITSKGRAESMEIIATFRIEMQQSRSITKKQTASRRWLRQR